MKIAMITLIASRLVQLDYKMMKIALAELND